MIGGYVYRDLDEDLGARLESRLGISHAKIDAWENGFLFHDDPFSEGQTSVLVSGDLIALSQDILVEEGDGGEYRRFDLRSELPELLSKGEPEAFDSISSEVRMAAMHRRGRERTLYLVGHRAGSGRIYYHVRGSGLVFSSDLRFLLSVVGCDASPIGIYAILKYGAVPEPMTISRTAIALPPAHCLRRDVLTGAQSILPYFRLSFPCDREGPGGRGEGEMLAPLKETLKRSARFLAKERPAILLSGGIDSSLYGFYLSETAGSAPPGFYCSFGEQDPELDFARSIADRIGSRLEVARMEGPDALRVLGNVTRWTDHPFSDFSSLPIAFLLDHAKERLDRGTLLVECNGGDDCFGFPDLGNEGKFALKHRVPRLVKKALAAALGRFGYWRWESHEGTLARLSALADVHERTSLDYFLVLAPMAYLGLKAPRVWDETLGAVFESVFAACGDDPLDLPYQARTTIRQLLHVNSRRWAAKALSVGESLGLRVVYPYLWREVLAEQGRIPWDAKIRDGIVKWPLKKLLEECMPPSFIYRKKSGFVPPFARWLSEPEFGRVVRDVLLDPKSAVGGVAPTKVLDALLSDAARGMKLRHSVLNFLWGALFSEMWIREHGLVPPLAAKDTN